MRILFIGNSHTYYNELPRIVRELLIRAGQPAEVVMQTEGGKDLLYHCRRHDVLFNIRHGNYDFIVLQDCATNFNESNFATALDVLDRDALSRTKAACILYMPWAGRDNPHRQPAMTDAYRKAARQLNCKAALAGDYWHRLLREQPDLPFYRDDGNHATPLGSYLAALTIFHAITGLMPSLTACDELPIIASLGLRVSDCRLLHQEFYKS